jgi:hypothetical protein
MSDMGCYRCGFNHDRDETCTSARDDRHRAYAEECKRLVVLSREAAAESVPDTEPEEAANG